jgi:hypothetical protein
MTAYGIIDLAEYQAICDKLREKTGTTGPIKSGEMLELIDSLGSGVYYENGDEVMY